MKNSRILFLLSLFFLIHSCQLGIKEGRDFTNAPEHLGKPYVLLISIDGYRHDYTALYNPPNLKKFIQKGIRSEGLIPVYPSNTFPNHYSIATGLHPGNHGIVSNSFWDPARRQLYRLGEPASMRDGSWYGGEPLWVATTKERMVSASYFWVGSEADIQGIHPTYWYPYNNRVPNRERIEQVLQWLRLPPKKRPHLITLYFSDVDRAGHRYGPESPKIREQVLALDKDLGYLFERLEGIDLDVNTIILSDHGMQQVGKGKTLYLTDYADLSPGIRVEGRGSHYLFYTSDHALRNKLHRQLKKVPHFDVYKREEVPARYHYNTPPRIGDVVLSVKSPYYMKMSRPLVGSQEKSGGTHGYDPFRNKNMNGIFYARGPQIRNRKEPIPAFRNIHVYPFVMDLLGLKVKGKIDGKWEVLASHLKEEKGGAADRPK